MMYTATLSQGWRAHGNFVKMRLYFNADADAFKNTIYVFFFKWRSKISIFFRDLIGIQKNIYIFLFD